MLIKITVTDRGNPPGKLADAELQWTDGPLAGLKLIGFGIWERRDRGRNVTFPARQYSVNGERRSFALLRPIVDAAAQDRIRDLILDAYDQHIEAQRAAETAGPDAVLIEHYDREHSTDHAPEAPAAPPSAAPTRKAPAPADDDLPF